MWVLHRLDEAAAQIKRSGRASAVAIGNFDGVHLGHAALLESMLKEARSRDLLSVVLTFYPHPVEVLHPGTQLMRLTTTSEKLQILERMGVDLVLVEKFDAGLSALSPETFFRYFLVEGLDARSLHVGFDFRFGHKRAGDTTRLGQLAEDARIALNVQPAFSANAGDPASGTVKISSSLIRELLSCGRVEDAARALGRPYFLTGQVVTGDHRGAALGFPTANIHVPPSKVLPKNGVYVTRALWQQQAFHAVTNVGLRPTFEGAATPRVEAHLLDFNSRLYDEELTLEFVSRLRDEKKFLSARELKRQIANDVAAARQRFA